MLEVMIWTAYAFSVVSFGLFVYFALLGRRAESAARGLGAALQQGALADMAALAEALAKLADSFSRAGPTVMALVASMFFFMAALVGARVG
jgi:hypothetical protein